MSESQRHPLNHLIVPAGQVAVHWFGQSSFALKTPAGTIIQIDPYFPRNRPPDKFLHPEPPLDEATLRTDAVLLTHDHTDHTCLESIARIDEANSGLRCLGPIESARRLRAAAIEMRDDDILSAGDVRQVNDLEIHAVLSKPRDGDPANGLRPPDVTHLGYVVIAGPVRLWFSGDPIRTFAELDDMVLPVRALAPQIGFITTHPTEGEFPCFNGTARVAQRVGLRTAVPQHYDCFVRRTFSPADWETTFRAATAQHPVQPLVLPYNSRRLFPSSN